MKVYLAEKQEVATAIATCLNPNYKSAIGYFDCGDGIRVTWCKGHLLSLTDPDEHFEEYRVWSLDQLPMKWPVTYKVNEKTAKQFRIVRKLLLEADEIISSTDIDDSGQAIGDEIYDFLNIPPEKIFRCLINDNNPRKIAKSLAPSAIRPNSEFRNLFYKEKARAIADMRLGYQMTRLLSCQAAKQGLKKTLNVGRVQTAILSLVVKRELTRTGHTKQTYFNVEGEFHTAGGVLKGRLNTEELNLHHRDDKNRLNNEQEVKSLVNSLRNKQAKLEFIETKQTADSPPLPFDLLSLQSECSRLFGIKPAKVMEITQKLRESPYYAITYNRSDCRYVAEDNFFDAPEIVANLSNIPILSPLASRCNTTIKSRCFSDANVGAHGAICPTGEFEHFDSMTDEMKVVFSLIARNYLLQFLDKREREITTYTFTISDDAGARYSFEGRTQRIIKLGWAEVFQNDAENEDSALEDLSGIDVSSLSVGETCKSYIEGKQMETKPPGTYTMATLLNDIKNTAKYISDEKIKSWMLEKDIEKKGENGGIGTSATRTSIIQGLFDNKFLVEDSKGKIRPTEEGYLLYQILPDSITSPNTTAIWSHYFKLIGNEDITVDEFLAYVDQFINSEIYRVKTEGLKIPESMLVKSHVPSSNSNAPKLTEKCPKCKHNAKLIHGRFGKFWECEGCKQKYDDLGNSIFYKSCPKCRKPLRITTPKKAGGKKFVSCTGYPSCDHKMNISDL